LDKYYDLPSSVAMSVYDLKKTPGFGIGMKASQKKMSLEAIFNPGPGTYETKSSFGVHDKSMSPNHKTPGYSLRIGHKAYEKVAGTQDPPRSGPDAFYDIKSFVRIN